MMLLGFSILCISLFFVGIGILFIANKAFDKSEVLGFFTSLLALIVPFLLFIGIVYLYGLTIHGSTIDFKWK